MVSRNRQSMSHSTKAWMLAIFTMAIGLSALTLLIFPRIEPLPTSQLDRSQSSGEIIEDMHIGQTFIATYSGLQRVDLFFANLTAPNRQAIVFHLKSSSVAIEDLATVVVSVGELEDNAFYSFEFPAIEGSAGRPFYVDIEAPGAESGESFTLLGSFLNPYDAGTAFLNGAPVADGDLAFVAHYKGTWRERGQGLLNRLSAGRPYFFGSKVFYLILALLYLALLLYLLRLLYEFVLSIILPGLFEENASKFSEQRLRDDPSIPWLWLIITAAILLRLIIAYVSPGAGYDIDSYRMQGEAVLNGRNVYEVTYRYPYPPLWMFIPAGALQLEQAVGLPFSFIVKLPALLAEVGILVLLWALRPKTSTGLKWLAIYAFNPVSLLTIAAHGQFDSIPLFFMLLAYIWWRKDKEGMLVRAALALGIGVAWKGFPILALPIYLFRLKWSKALRFTWWTLLPTTVILAPFLVLNPLPALRNVFLHVGVLDHGLGYLLQWLSDGNGIDLVLPSRQLERFVLAFGILLGSWRCRRADPAYAQAGVFAVIYTIGLGIASQYMLWILPFLIVVGLRQSIVYSIASGLALAAFYGTHFPRVLSFSQPLFAAPYSGFRLGATALWWGVCLILATLMLSQARSGRKL